MPVVSVVPNCCKVGLFCFCSDSAGSRFLTEPKELTFVH